MIGAGFMGQGLTNQIVNSHARHAHGGDLQPPSQRAFDVYTLLRRDGRGGSRPRQDDARRGDPRRQAGGHRRCRSCWRAPRKIDVLVDVTGSVEFGARVHPRGVQARQGRRADERRDRRHHRSDPAGLRREARRHPLRLRRRRARRPDESCIAGSKGSG